jgi:NitT/TauT family transport system substrate-binding protein
MSLQKSLGCIVTAISLSGAVANAQSVNLTIPTLPSPSLGAFMGPVIKAKKFDEQNGLNLTFVQKPTATYRTDFAAGTDQLGGSGTLLADVALLNEKGLNVVYLFNVFDFWATVIVPSSSEVKTVTDLKGKTLAASLPTASFPMFRYLAKLGGLDMETVQLRNSDSSGLVPIAKSGRTDAVQLWEPSYSILIHGNRDFRSIDVMSKWRETTGLAAFPYLGISAQRAWVNQNRTLIPKLYATYEKAADFIKKNPGEAATIIAKELGIAEPVIQELTASDRLQLNIYWASANKAAAEEVFKAAQSVGYLKSAPNEGMLYDPGR